LVVSASTGAASQPRRCCAPPRFSNYLQHAKDYGLSAGEVTYDPAAVVKRSRAVSKRLNDGVGFLMKKNKVTVIWGEAVIDAPGKITVKAGKSEAPKGALGAGSYQAKHRTFDLGGRHLFGEHGLYMQDARTSPLPAACTPRLADPLSRVVIYA
jgi:pyruvate/2-oxoglutarate dehydrogenase complex dihydrolipoamide dehydrogenase (E3) component